MAGPGIAYSGSIALEYRNVNLKGHLRPGLLCPGRLHQRLRNAFTRAVEVGPRGLTGRLEAERRGWSQGTGTSQTSRLLKTETASMDSGSASDGESDALSSLLDAETAEHDGKEGPNAGALASVGSIAGIFLLLGAGMVFKDSIKDFLTFFIDTIETYGPLGYLAYAVVYAGLEVLAVPAIPLTMTAGVIFGPIPGTIITSLSGTFAATIAFLIARYAARERVMRWARRNSKFAAIDRAIAKDGFKFVTLLRLSPLFPLAASNYLYGLTSVDLMSYVAGSFIGMLPGTYAYVSAGHLGKAALMEGEGSVGVESWQVAMGLGVTLLAIGYIGRLAKNAIKEAESGTSDTE